MIDTAVNYDANRSVQDIYNEIKLNSQREREERRSANGTDNQFKLRLTGSNKFHLAQIPPGDKTRVINAALAEYFEKCEYSKAVLVFVPGSGVFSFDLVKEYMDRSIRKELEDADSCMTPQEFVDDYIKEHDKLYDLPFMVRPYGKQLTKPNA